MPDVRSSSAINAANLGASAIDAARGALSPPSSSFDSLLESSVFADLGCIEPKAMMADLDNFASGTGDLVTSLYTALSLETWLSSRTGRYMPTGS